MHTQGSNMPTTTFTTRIDQDLKARLERIARLENRSASDVANRAIEAAVLEREATHELVDIGLQMVDDGWAQNRARRCETGCSLREISPSRSRIPRRASQPRYERCLPGHRRSRSALVQADL